MTSGLKMLPSACGLGQHFQDLGHSFSLSGPPSQPVTYIDFRFPCGQRALKWQQVKYILYQYCFSPLADKTLYNVVFPWDYTLSERRKIYCFSFRSRVALFATRHCVWAQAFRTKGIYIAFPSGRFTLFKKEKIVAFY